MTQQFVCGFLFRQLPGKSMEVALIRKQKPAWQRDKWNGVGGKVNPNEAPVQAMSREFMEETGCVVPAGSWTPFMRVSHSKPSAEVDGNVYFFATRMDSAYIESQETETVFWCDLAGLCDDRACYPVIPNLRWLIPMALHALTPGVMLTGAVRLED